MENNNTIISQLQSPDKLPGVILSGINSVDDLRALPVSDLEQLSFELRHYIIHTLALHPGHLASSLGTV